MFLNSQLYLEVFFSETRYILNYFNNPFLLHEDLHKCVENVYYNMAN